MNIVEKLQIDLKNPGHIKNLILAAIFVAIAIFVATHYIGESGEDEAMVERFGESAAAEEAQPAAAGESSAEGGQASKEQQEEGAEVGGDAVAAAAGSSPIYVDVAGAVKKPMVVELPSGSRIFEAIDAAGGAAGEADLTYINRAAVLSDGDRVYVPSEDEVAAGAMLPSSAGSTAVGAQGANMGTEPYAGGAFVSGAEMGAGAEGAAAKVNINTADSGTLQQLNGVGPATAQKIIDYREQTGKFSKPEDIKNVSGIGEKTFEKMRDFIVV